MKPQDQILSAVEIRWPEAAWVLTAHLYAVLMPLALCVAVYYHWDYLVQTTHNPFLFYVAVGLLCAGSAFEVAQNSIDKWYLTDAAASTTGVGFCDFLFYWTITAGEALCAVALGGDAWWVILIAVAAVIALPICYFTQVAHFAPLSIAGLLVVGLAYTTFGDPIVFMQILLGFTTMYFFTALLKTGAQVIHGFTTIAASSGVWFFVWAMHNGATGVQNSWSFTALILAAVLITGAVAWPLLARLPSSQRVVRQGR